MAPVKGTIVYLNSGVRRYAEHPVKANRRGVWELQCFIRGHAFPTGSLAPAPRPAPVAYLFPPWHDHGWSAPKGDLSEVLVFHVTAPLKAVDSGRDDSSDQVEMFVLRELDLLRLGTIYDWLEPHFIAPTEFGSEVLSAGVVFLRSTLEDLRHGNVCRTEPLPLDADSRVAQARYLFLQKVNLNPSVTEISEMMGLSASQLRRLFATSGQASPLQVFRGIQLDYARRMLSASHDPVARIADELGFGSVSSFTRAFTRHFGSPPTSVRKSRSGNRLDI